MPPKNTHSFVVPSFTHQTAAPNQREKKRERPQRNGMGGKTGKMAQSTVEFNQWKIYMNENEGRWRIWAYDSDAILSYFVITVSYHMYDDEGLWQQLLKHNVA